MTLPGDQTIHFDSVRKGFLRDFNVKFKGSTIPLVVQFFRSDLRLHISDTTNYRLPFPLNPEYKGIWVPLEYTLIYDINKRLASGFPCILEPGMSKEQLYDEDGEIITRSQLMPFTGVWSLNKCTKNVPDTLSGGTRLAEISDMRLTIT